MEANPELEFDRQRAYGFHLALPSGEFMRFEPGEPKTINLVRIGGSGVIQGASGLANGPIDQGCIGDIVQRLQQAGYRHVLDKKPNPQGLIQPVAIDRAKYAAAYGPTTGDCLRLGPTNLWVRIEKDFTTYGDECTLGCGKSLRDGMGAASGCSDAECLDLAIINAVIIDWTGIFKADIGIRDGLIVAIGKAGNPATMDGVSEHMTIGSNTDVIDAGGRIITAGGIDTHVHHICPQQAQEALASGITTLFGGGTGPRWANLSVELSRNILTESSTSSTAVNSTAGVRHIKQMMQACDKLPINYGLVGKGSDSGMAGLRDQCYAGVVALKLHEDFGCTPATIDSCLK
jgi:urease